MVDAENLLELLATGPPRAPLSRHFLGREKGWDRWCPAQAFNNSRNGWVCSGSHPKGHGSRRRRNLADPLSDWLLPSADRAVLGESCTRRALCGAGHTLRPSLLKICYAMSGDGGCRDAGPLWPSRRPKSTAAVLQLGPARSGRRGPTQAEDQRRGTHSSVSPSEHQHVPPINITTHHVPSGLCSTAKEVEQGDAAASLNHAAAALSKLSHREKMEWSISTRRRGNALYEEGQYQEAMAVYLEVCGHMMIQSQLEAFDSSHKCRLPVPYTVSAGPAALRPADPGAPCCGAEQHGGVCSQAGGR